jgi:hypothetical protein
MPSESVPRLSSLIEIIIRPIRMHPNLVGRRYLRAERRLPRSWGSTMVLSNGTPLKHSEIKGPSGIRDSDTTFDGADYLSPLVNC